MPRSAEANRELRSARRARLLDAAHRVFARRGVSGTMAEIAKEAGVSQGLAYRYFPSKEALLRGLVGKLTEQGGGQAARLRAIAGTPGERLRAIVIGILTRHREQAEFFQLFYEFLADPRLPKAQAALVSRSGLRLEAALREIIVAGQATGEVAGGDPDQLVEALMSLLEGHLRRASRMTPTEVRRRFPSPEIVLRLLFPAVPSPRAPTRRVGTPRTGRPSRRR